MDPFFFIFFHLSLLFTLMIQSFPAIKITSSVHRLYGLPTFLLPSGPVNHVVYIQCGPVHLSSVRYEI